jgi:hypothetical protein
MRRLVTRIPAALITFVLGVASANFAAHVWPSAASRAADERAILAVEREYIRAHTERDVLALDRVLADDFSSFGGRVKKEHRLALLASPFYIITSVATDDVVVHLRGDEAWVSGKARMSGSFRGREFTTPTYEFKRRLERRQGQWLIVSCTFAFAW